MIKREFIGPCIALLLCVASLVYMFHYSYVIQLSEVQYIIYWIIFTIAFFQLCICVPLLHEVFIKKELTKKEYSKSIKTAYGDATLGSILALFILLLCSAKVFISFVWLFLAVVALFISVSRYFMGTFADIKLNFFSHKKEDCHEKNNPTDTEKK